MAAVSLDPFQRIVSVGWASGAFAVIEVYAYVSNALVGSLAPSGLPSPLPSPPSTAGLVLGCSFPGYDPKNVDPAIVKYAFPPSDDMKDGARAWSEPFLIGDPVTQDQSIHTFVVNLSKAKEEVIVFSIVALNAGANLPANLRVVTSLFDHADWQKEIVGSVGGVDVIARNGPVMLPQPNTKPRLTRVVSTIPNTETFFAKQAAVFLLWQTKSVVVNWS